MLWVRVICFWGEVPMNFGIVTDTAGAKVADLASELRAYIEPKINEK